MPAPELSPEQQTLFQKAMEWSHHPQRAVEKIREEALRSHTDPTEQIQRHMLSWIAHDDGRCLPLYIGENDIDNYTAWMHQQLLISRLTYETKLSELPDDVRQRAQIVLDVAQQTEIDSLDTYRSLRDKWFTEVHDYVHDRYHPAAV